MLARTKRIICCLYYSYKRKGGPKIRERLPTGGECLVSIIVMWMEKGSELANANEGNMHV